MAKRWAQTHNRKRLLTTCKFRSGLVRSSLPNALCMKERTSVYRQKKTYAQAQCHDNRSLHCVASAPSWNILGSFIKAISNTDHFCIICSRDANTMSQTAMIDSSAFDLARLTRSMRYPFNIGRSDFTLLKWCESTHTFREKRSLYHHSRTEGNDVNTYSTETLQWVEPDRMSQTRWYLDWT